MVLLKKEPTYKNTKEQASQKDIQVPQTSVKTGKPLKELDIRKNPQINHLKFQQFNKISTN